MDVDILGEGTADYYHVMAEATHEGLHRPSALSDGSGFAHIPAAPARLNGRQQAARITWTGVPTPCPLPPAATPSGWALWTQQQPQCPFIQSIYHEFGSGVVADNAGFVLQNRGNAFCL